MEKQRQSHAEDRHHFTLENSNNPMQNMAKSNIQATSCQMVNPVQLKHGRRTRQRHRVLLTAAATSLSVGFALGAAMRQVSLGRTRGPNRPNTTSAFGRGRGAAQSSWSGGSVHHAHRIRFGCVHDTNLAIDVAGWMVCWGLVVWWLSELGGLARPQFGGRHAQHSGRDAPTRLSDPRHGETQARIHHEPPTSTQDHDKNQTNINT